MDSCISLHCDGHRHENGGCHHDHLPRIEEVWEQVGMHSGHQLEALSDALQDGANQVAHVKDGQRDQHQVEAVAHLFVSQDDNGYEVAEEAARGHQGLQDALEPEAEAGQQSLASFVILRAVEGDVHICGLGDHCSFPTLNLDCLAIEKRPPPPRGGRRGRCASIMPHTEEQRERTTP